MHRCPLPPSLREVKQTVSRSTSRQPITVLLAVLLQAACFIDAGPQGNNGKDSQTSTETSTSAPTTTGNETTGTQGGTQGTTDTTLERSAMMEINSIPTNVQICARKPSAATALS